MKLAWLALAWVAYAALHSALASFAPKAFVARRWPGFAPWYRLSFNAVAAVTLLPILWATYAIEGAPLWQWPAQWRWLSYGLVLAALAGFFATTRWYDMAAFAGLRQIRERSADTFDGGRLVLSPFHRCVRHPWYFFGLILVWAGDKNAPLLVSSVAITLYFIVGSRLEERKLVAVYGERYRRYRERVPGLLPLPWKCLNAAEADELSR